MKKLTDNHAPGRKLVLRREAITVLARSELVCIAGGWSQDLPCGPGTEGVSLKCGTTTIS